MRIRAARNVGVESIVVTHPLLPSVKINLNEMKQAAVPGAYMEFTYSGAWWPFSITHTKLVASFVLPDPSH